uniref:Uncharacterized protein n=1 Tax=Mycena chlorophos TaxID=658473 RepID=A0ABQ0LSD8_MYCCL|nr:predicted protein [Mycena chlorophos]
MASPAPALATSTSRNWPRPEGPAFAGRGRGRGRGGRGGRGRANGNATSTPSVSSPPARQEAQAPKQPTPTVQAPASAVSAAPNPVTKSTSTPATPSEPKERSGRSKGRRASKPPPPALVVESAGPSAESSVPAATTAPRSSNRRRRSQQLSKANVAASNLKVEVPPAEDNLLRPQNNRSTAPPPTAKDMPPHLAGSFNIRSDINALVERVRAVAMENRPTTPGTASHIDWAGDDDESLPDLDDWGVKTTPATTAADKQKDEMISPIIVDGLTPLPEPIEKAPTPPEEAKHVEVFPFAVKQPEQSTPASLHPSLPPKPVDVALAETKLSSPGKSTEQAASPQKSEGLAASIHAEPAVIIASSSKLSPYVPEFNPSHQRAHTMGRPFPHTAPISFNNRFPRGGSGASTPRGGYVPRNQHSRAQSSPSASPSHRTSHSRPVITGDAISRLARTIAAPARAPAIPTNN